MKVNIEIDCTPEEARSFMGLPDVGKANAVYVDMMSKAMAGVSDTDKLQEYARRALMDGLIDYDQNEGFRGPVASVDISGEWGEAVSAIKPLSDVPEWTLAVVLEIAGNEAKIGQLNPLTRYGVPDEIAYAGLFLASDEAKQWPPGMLAKINAL